MLELTELSNYLATYLKIDLFDDYGPNGLQVEGRPKIKKILTGVTASQALLDVAIEKKVDAVLVHHGYFWHGEDPAITGIKKNRIASLLKHDISLLAYHLPLDAHPEVGNNRQLANILDIRAEQPGKPTDIIWSGQLSKPLTFDEMAAHINKKLDREPLAVCGGEHSIKKLAWCTGGAQKFIDRVCDVDAYITGEISESSYHVAQERGIHFFSAGHHATERYGIKALGEHLQQKFDIDCEFVDIPNPV